MSDMQKSGVRQPLTFVALAFLIAVLFVVASLCLMPVTASRGGARNSQCRNNLKQFGLALHNYHDEYGSFPPAYVTNADGKRLHSWRTLILPYVDEAPLYEQYRFGEAWDSPHNLGLVEQSGGSPWICPSDPDYDLITASTNYVAVVGSETAWDSDRAVRLDEFTDGLSQTILLVEAAPALGSWFEPQDLEFDTMSFRINDPDQLSISSHHVTKADWPWEDEIPFVHVLMADGAARRLPLSTPPDVVRALLTISGGEDVEVDWIED